MENHESGLTKFTYNGITWECWVVDGGQRYEWQALNGRLKATRREGHGWVSSLDGKDCNGSFPTLKAAMAAAQARLLDVPFDWDNREFMVGSR